MANFDVTGFKEAGSAIGSISMCLYAQVENLRNSDEGMGTLEMIGRRIVGELAYAGIVVAAAVETVFRAAIGLIALPFAFLLPEECCGDLFAVIVVIGFVGGVYSVEAGVFGLVSLVTNIYQQKMTIESVYNQIIPECMDNVNDRLSQMQN